MKQELDKQNHIFDETHRRFGNFEGMTIMDPLSKMREELNELHPVRKQILSIRVPVLQKAAEWKTAPPLRQARNGLAHGGHILTDINAIAREKDPAEQDKLKQGFESLYHLKFDGHGLFSKFNAVVNIANIHANLLTLDEFNNRDADVRSCKKLLEDYETWTADGGNFDKYPFTNVMVGPYNRLMRLYDHTLL